MARIRTVKPEFFTDEKVGEVSLDARLLFIGAWVFADDYGTLDRSAKQLKAQVFPYDSIDCEPLVEQLLHVGLLAEYESDGKTYLTIPGFAAHQRIDKPSKPRRPLPEDSGSTPRILVSGKERKGKEGKGEEVAAPAEAVDGLDAAAWDRWHDYRVKIRKPLKPVSIPAAQRELAAFGCNQTAVVEQSIAHGWQGLFELKRTPGLNGARPHSSGRHLKTADEIEAEERARAAV